MHVYPFVRIVYSSHSSCVRFLAQGYITILHIKPEHYKPKFHHVYTIPSFHITLNFFYFTSSIYTIKSKVRQGVRGDGRGSKPV